MKINSIKLTKFRNYDKVELNFNDSLKRKFIYYLEEMQISSFDEIKKYLKNEPEDLLKINNIKTNINLYHFLCNVLPDDFVIDKEKEEVRKRRVQSRTIEQIYEKVEELTL